MRAAPKLCLYDDDPVGIENTFFTFTAYFLKDNACVRGRLWHARMGWLTSHLILKLLVAIISGCILPVYAHHGQPASSIDAREVRALREHVRMMFYHGFQNYREHALPADELLPITCSGRDTFGGVSATLIDTLDTLVILKDWPAFVWGVRYVRNRVNFHINSSVSVFETTIRVVGGLLSAHQFLTESASDVGFDVGFWYPDYDNCMLYLAQDLADRLLPAFSTPTGIPFGAINLKYGVAANESKVASTAGAGSLIMEFGTLSRFVQDPKYYQAAFRAMQSLHQRASMTGLVGNHINIVDGDWVATEAGVGGLIDSYYEYMIKGYILFRDPRLLRMFHRSYLAVSHFIHKPPWYFNADMFTGMTLSWEFSALSAFWPGLQVLVGDIDLAAETVNAHYAVWRRYGCVPEGYHVGHARPIIGHEGYPLRPELIESMFYLHWATNQTHWLTAARAMTFSLDEITRVTCGFARVKDVRTRQLEDLMDSFMLSETLKYLYLLFSGDSDSTSWVRSGKFVFTTEAHPLHIFTWKFGVDVARR